ncbi:MAG TPA: glycosyltransferase family 4 protein [Azospirillaceae bacterium]|nr:glycosyltransferase family 4 protein [Azospirillaceae bacterium]
MTSTQPILGLLVVLASGAGAWAVTGRVLRHLRRRAILDMPNERSSHTVPTPRGGGWGILAGIVPAWLVLGVAGGDTTALAALPGCLVVAAVSWLDDRGGLGPAVRLAAQFAAAGLGMWMLPPDALALQGLVPVWVDRVLAAVAWVWFMNLYNFMDGIDGIAGSQAASVGAGIALVVWTAGLPDGNAWPALSLAAAAAGFLVWNWHPARVFMGDVGSVPLGYLLGWLLLGLAVHGQWAAALLLPLFFVADATTTLVRRAAAGKPVWLAHREHAYQKAVQRGLRHDTVVVRMLGLNGVLLILAAVATAGPAAAVAAAAAGLAITLAALRLLAGPGMGRTSAEEAGAPPSG